MSETFWMNADDMEGIAAQCELVGMVDAAGRVRRMAARITALEAENKRLVAEVASLRQSLVGSEFPGVEPVGCPTPGACSAGAICAENARLRDENAEIRRYWCVAYAGFIGAYLDDGEATDGRAAPIIDFVRDDLDTIKAKMHERFVAALKEPSDGKA